MSAITKRDRVLQIGDRVRVCGFSVNGAATVIEETELWCCGKRIVRVRTDWNETGHFCQSRLVLLAYAMAGFSDDGTPQKESKK